jgi:tetratricopeptide (TPR) repeat protein
MKQIRTTTIVLATFAALAAFTQGYAQNRSVPALEQGGVFKYPSAEYWKDPEVIKNFLGSYGIRSEVEPKISEEEGALFKKVIELMQTDRRLALQMLEQGTTPQSSAALDFNIANLHVEFGELDEAIANYAKALEKFPSFQRAHHLMGIMLCQQQNYEEAVKHLMQAAKLGSIDGTTYGLLGLCYLNLEQRLAAESAYRNAIIFDPVTTDWQMGLARALMEEGKYQESSALLEELIKKTPNADDLWMFQANAFIALDEMEKAASNFEIVRRMGKATPDVLLAVGDIYINKGLQDLAVEAYMEALEKDPNQPAERLVRAAQILVGRGSLDQAKTLIARLQTLNTKIEDEDQLAILRLKSQIALAEGRDDEAAEILLQVIERSPLDGQALVLLARHQQQIGDIARAEEYYKRAAKVPGFEADALVAHAQMLVNEGRYGAAVPLLERAQGLRPRENVERFLKQVRDAYRTQGVF